MSIELKTVMGQMNIVRGRWVSEAPSALAVREPSGRRWGGPSKGDLFVVVEVRGDCEEAEREALNRSLAQTIRNTYYQSSGSVTASLRRALLAAHQRLLAESARRPDSSGLLGGVTAVAVRGEDVFIASVGPAVAYAVTRGVATRFPEASRWLDMADPAAAGASALGRDREVDIQLFHVRVEPGDMLVLGDSRFAARTSPEGVEKAVAYQGVEGALSNLGRLTGGHDCTALVVEIQAKKARVGEPVAAGAAPGPSVARTEAVPQAPPSQVGSKGPAEPVGPGRKGYHPLGDVGKLGRSAAPRPEIRRPRRSLWPGLSVAVPLGRWLVGLGKGLLALLMVVGAGLRTLISRVLPGQERGGAVRRRGGVGQARRVQSPQLPQRLLRAVALAILVVVALAVGLTYWRQGLARENEFNALVEQAQTAYQQALSADEATARELLAQAETSLAQAETIKPDDPIVGELRTSIAEQQDKINRVERLYWLGELRTYDTPGTRLRRVVVNGLDVYVLDTGTDQVFHHRLDEVNDALQPDEGDPVLVRRGQQVDTAVVGEMIDLVWMPAGGERQTSDLLILESGGLLEYNPSWGLATSPIVNKDAWALPVAVGSYFGNFYILDPQMGQILRYLPSAEGYTNPAQYYFPDEVTVDLTGAVDMAIDGFIYVLFADGTIRKFEGGVPVEFEITEIDKPLDRPTAIYTAPDDVAQYLYVADAGNRRVVQLTKEGRFLRQFRPRDEEAVSFNALQSLFVDELTGKLYLLTDHSLYIANITPFQ